MKKLTKEDKQILYVDDEKENLDGFHYTFRWDYTVFVAHDVKNAMEIISQNDIKVVIADQRMPDMQGTDLLDIISEQYPNIIRIILTAYAEVDVIMKAVNKGKVYRFMMKPWDKKEFFNALENAFETWNLRNENTLLIEDLKNTNERLNASNENLKNEIDARKNAQEELTEYKNHLETLVRERTEEIEQINQQLASSNDKLKATIEELNFTNNKLKEEVENRREAQEHLTMSEEKFRRFMEQSTDAIALVDINGSIVEWNNASEHIFGINKTDAVGKYIADVDYSLQPPDKQTTETKERIYNAVKQFLDEKSSEKQMSFETEIIDCKDNKRFVTASIFHIQTHSGSFIGRIIKDITMRKNMEEELKKYQDYLEKLVEEKTGEIKENQARLSLVLNSVPLAFYILPANQIKTNTWISDQIITITGYSKEEFEKNDELWLDNLHPDDRMKVLAEFDKIEEKGQISNEYRWKDKKGEYRWFLDKAKLIHDHNRKPHQVIGVWIDITARKNTEAELEKYRNHLEVLVKDRTEELEQLNEEFQSTNEELYEKNEELRNINDKLQVEIKHRKKIKKDLELSENLFRNFLEQSSDGVSLLTSDGKIIEWNLAIEKITGITKKDVLNKDIRDVEFELMLEENKTSEKRKTIRNSIDEYLNHVKQKNTDFTLEEYIQNKQKEEKYIQVSVFPVKTQDNFYIGRIFRDITEKRQKDIELENYRNKLELIVDERTAQLKKSEEKFSKVFKFSPSYIILSSLNEGRIMDVNDAFLEDFGFYKDEIIGKTAVELNLTDIDTLKSIAGILKEKGFYENLEMNLKTKQGNILSCISSGEIIEIDNEKLVVQVVTDITGRKLAEDEIRQKNHELLTAEEELVSANEELRTINDELEDRNKMLKNANQSIAESEERFRSLFEQAVDGILVGDKSGKIIDANTYMSRMTGYSKEELINKNIDILFSKNDLGEKPLRYDLVNVGITVHREREIICKSGKRIPTEMNTKQLPDGRLQSFLRDISDRVNAERALKESEEKYRTLVEGQTELVVKINTQGEFQFVSPSYCKIFGKTEDELLGKRFIPLVHEHDREVTENAMRNLHKPPYKAYIEQRVFTKNGWRWIAWSDSAILNDQSEVVEIIGVGRDITQRKQYEEDLVRTNNLLAGITNATPDVIFILSLVEWRFEYYNNRLNELFQYTNEDIERSDNVVLLLVSEEDHESPDYHFERLLEAGDDTIIASEVRMQRKDGEILWALVREQIFERDMEGNPIKSVGVITDITKRKRSEIALKESESKFRLLFENANDAIFLMKEETFISCNKKTLEVFKCTTEDILGRTPFEFSPEKQPNGHSSKQETLLKIGNALKGKIDTFEWKHKRLDGSLFDAEVSLNILKLNEELFLQAIVRDVSDRKKAEKDLKERENLLNAIINNLPFDFWTRDTEGKLIMQNDYSLKLWGDLRNSKIADNSNMSKRMRDDWMETFERGLKGEVVSKEYDYEQINGKYIQKIVAPIISKNKIRGVLGFDIDITERKNTEKKILDAIIFTEEKEREKFAKNLHDDLGPLLSSIRMYMNSFMETDNQEKQKYIIQQINDILKESIQATKQISNDLSPHVLTNYGLISAVEAFIERLTHHLQIHFEHHLKDHRFNSSIEVTFYRIIKELINNTIKHASAENIYIHLFVNNDHLYLDYEDDGIGFDKNIMDQVEKRGMGLFNLMSRIKSLHGKFHLGSAAKGVQIKIEVPLYQ